MARTDTENLGVLAFFLSDSQLTKASVMVYGYRQDDERQLRTKRRSPQMQTSGKELLPNALLKQPQEMPLITDTFSLKGEIPSDHCWIYLCINQCLVLFRFSQPLYLVPPLCLVSVTTDAAQYLPRLFISDSPDYHDELERILRPLLLPGRKRFTTLVSGSSRGSHTSATSRQISRRTFPSVSC